MFASVRELLETWFASFPAEAQADVRSRFRSADQAEYLGAFWEIYLHEVHCRLGFDLHRDPTVPETSKRPDFLVRGDGRRFYLEATVVTYSRFEAAQRRRDGLLVDLVNEAFDPDFAVFMGTAAAGPTTPRRSEVVEPIQEWLSGFDWETERALVEQGQHNRAERTFTPRDSVLTLQPYPKPPQSRGDPSFPTVAAGPTQGGVVDEASHIYSDLHDKASHYGRPDHPFVIAALCLRDFVEDRDIDAALYGPEVFRIPILPEGGAGTAYVDREPMGLWQRGTEQRATRVSGVLTAIGLGPYFVATMPLTLWTNPWASMPLEAELPWRTVSGDLASNRLVTADATRQPHEILGLPPDWPPGRPFD